jgi:hypothetical protein
MTENDFITTAQKEMISCSVEILNSLTQDIKNESESESLRNIQNANLFEEQFSARTHAILFNMLREFETEHHTSISTQTGEEIEQIYDQVLLAYGNHLACGLSLGIKFEYNTVEVQNGFQTS